jgi:hypothetical protein
VLTNVSTEVPGHEQVWITNDGTIQLQQGGWELTRIIDMRGRILHERNNDGSLPDLRDEPSGLYLVCLRQGSVKWYGRS